MVIEISDVGELQAIASNVTASYVLINDIDASETSSWNNGQGFVPISSFSGSLDGQGHIISGLRCNRPTVDHQGLFASPTTAAVIENLGLTDVYMNGYLYVAGISTRGGPTIRKCFTTGTVISGHWYAGGVAGMQIAGGGIFDCYSHASVYIVRGSAGGICGVLNDGGSMARCYSTGAISGGTGATHMGGLIGYKSAATFANGFYDTETSGMSDTGKGTPKTTAQMKEQGTFTGFDFDEVWSMHGGSYPVLAWQVPHAPVNTLNAKVWDGEVFKTASGIKRWNGTAWEDITGLKTFDGETWK